LRFLANRATSTKGFLNFFLSRFLLISVVRAEFSQDSLIDRCPDHLLNADAFLGRYLFESCPGFRWQIQVDQNRAPSVVRVQCLEHNPGVVVLGPISSW
jgi:hypothetical protein